MALYSQSFCLVEKSSLTVKSFEHLARVYDAVFLDSKSLLVSSQIADSYILAVYSLTTFAPTNFVSTASPLNLLCPFLVRYHPLDHSKPTVTAYGSLEGRTFVYSIALDRVATVAPVAPSHGLMASTRTEGFTLEQARQPGSSLKQFDEADFFNDFQRYGYLRR